jgi:hypothetical protein
VSQRRGAEDRARARALGVDRFGRPTARSLGISPRQLRADDPALDRDAAARLSARLLEATYAELGGRGDSSPRRAGVDASPATADHRVAGVGPTPALAPRALTAL